MKQLSGVTTKKTNRRLIIDFGQATTKILLIEYSVPGQRLLHYGLHRIISQEAKDQETENFVKSFLSDHRILEREAVLVISEPGAVAVKYLIMPVLAANELMEAARLLLKEEAIELSDFLCECQSVREYKDEDGARRQGTVFALAKKETVNRYLAFALRLGLEPQRVTSAPFNYAQIMHYCPPCEHPIVCVLDIGYQEASLYIYNHGKLNFARRLSFSAHNLTRSLSGTLVSDKGRIELSFAQAEEIKGIFGIPMGLQGELKDNIQASQVMSLMLPFLEGLVRELKFSLNYFNSNIEPQKAGALYLTGGGSNLKNLDKYLQKEAGLDTLYLPTPRCVDIESIAKDKREVVCIQITSALGAALAGERDVNFLPPEIKARKREALQKSFLKLAVVTAAAVFVFLLFTYRFLIHDYQHRINNARIHLNASGEIMEINRKIYARQAVMDAAEQGQVPVPGLLKLLSNIVPKEMVLDELILDQGARNLTLKGRVFAPDISSGRLLKEFMRQVEKSSFFGRANIYVRNSGGAQEFDLRCSLAN